MQVPHICLQPCWVHFSPLLVLWRWRLDYDEGAFPEISEMKGMTSHCVPTVCIFDTTRLETLENHAPPLCNRAM